jgi:hypothetical protein
MNKYFKKPFAKKKKCVIISKRMGKYHHLNDISKNKKLNVLGGYNVYENTCC